MLTHLRLARARGSLMVPNSRIQDQALAYLDMLDVRDRAEQRRDMVKATLAAGNYEETRFQFPEYFGPADPFEQAKTPDGGYDIDKIDDASVAWAVPDEDEDEALSRWIDQHQAGSFGSDEIE